MAYKKTSFVEHTAIYVQDIHWSIRFFKEALGMPVAHMTGTEENPVSVWTVGGVQMYPAKDYKGPEGRLAHLGIRCEDLEAVLEEVYSHWGAKSLPQGRNWIELPDGLQIELMQVAK